MQASTAPMRCNAPGCTPRPPTASDLPGLEASGEVVSVGEGVSDLSIGDKVCALLPGGGYAEYVATPAAHCLPVPQGLGMKEAACLPETFFTVWSNVFTRGGLAGRRTVLDPRRVLRNRHDRHSVGQRIRRPGFCNSRFGRKMRGMRRIGRGTRDQLSRPKISST